MRNPFDFFVAHKRAATTVFLRSIIVLVLLGGLVLVLKETLELGARSLSNQGQGKAITLPTQSSSSMVSNTISGLLKVQDNHIVDASGQQVVLRGAHVTSAFGYIDAWKHGADPFGALNPEVYAAMVQWGMNVVRVPISYWVYQLSPKDYLKKLDTVIQQANAAKLYVVLNNRDDDQAGSPYGTGASLPKPETIALWRIFAKHYASNPMLLFDIYNEPAQTSWAQWLNGGGTMIGSTGKKAPVIGMQKVVDAVRSVGAHQIIIAEASTEMTGFDGIGNDLIKDPNIVYSVHEYFDWRKNNNLDRSPAGWDLKFGNLSTAHPIFIGEWAFLPNANHIVFCEDLTTSQASQLVQSFLSYMQQRNVSWTAWDFDLDHLILNYKSFAPTTLHTHWHCGNMSSDAGMGTLIKQYLTNM